MVSLKSLRFIANLKRPKIKNGAQGSVFFALREQFLCHGICFLNNCISMQMLNYHYSIRSNFHHRHRRCRHQDHQKD